MVGTPVTCPPDVVTVGTEHGVGLAASSLPVGKHGRIAAIEHERDEGARRAPVDALVIVLLVERVVKRELLKSSLETYGYDGESRTRMVYGSVEKRRFLISSLIVMLT
mgnify:CR=1 FL=1